MSIIDNKKSPKQEKKVANQLYKSIVVVITIAALCLIIFRLLVNKSPLEIPTPPSQQEESRPLQNDVIPDTPPIREPSI